MNEVTNFMYYMYNRWNFDECVSLFGERLGKHIWEKFERRIPDTLLWYSDLDNDCRRKLVDRANEIYAK